MRLIDVPMGENDVNAKTVGEFLKMLLLYLWAEAETFSAKRPFGNSDWQFQVYASLIKAGYEIGELDEDGYVESIDFAKADKLVAEAITEVFADEPVKHGAWIEDGYHGNPFVCSYCGHEGCYYGNCDNKQYYVTNYCPNCGAKMDLEG